MRKTILITLLITFTATAMGQGSTQSHYAPAQENLRARTEFQDMKYGLFIHWGVFSVLGDGEWVMNNRNIKADDYKRLLNVYDPVDFDARKWVAMAKDAGMKYITFVTRHHDGFSNWDTHASDWKVSATHYRKDVLKELAKECRRQGIRLFLYYSLLDWSREDYPWQTGRTGKGTGRAGQGDYDHYLNFMKTQLTELLTQYGKIAGIWFDGNWDQTEPEGSGSHAPRINWKYDEIYDLIHRLQPQCLIGNNHHLAPQDGEDFQMFERDLPGQNNSGLSFQQPSNRLPLETCETMNNSWGYNITDRSYKSAKQIVDLLVNAAGRNANLLLNVGPMANGTIQPEFTDTLARVGNWLKTYGGSVYGTRGRIVDPQQWGVLTGKEHSLYVHILHPNGQPVLFIPGIQKINAAESFRDHKTLSFEQKPEGVYVHLEGLEIDPLDTVIELKFGT
jgi:alpha-L-fucosidase